MTIQRLPYCSGNMLYARSSTHTFDRRQLLLVCITPFRLNSLQPRKVLQRNNAALPATGALEIFLSDPLDLHLTNER